MKTVTATHFIMWQGYSMSIVKDIQVRTITSKVANEFVRKHHYSGKVVPNSQLHFGAFLNGVLHGVMSFGASMDKRKIQGLVADTGWNDFIELNRMAFDDKLPKNSESRCIAVALRIIKKKAPNIKWVVSFADATQCGDGTIYRASGFVLTGIKPNKQILNWNGNLIAKKTLDNKNYPKIDGKYYSRYLLETGEATPLDGWQLRYIYFIDKTYRSKLTVPELDYSVIDDNNAKMYKGMRQQSKSKTAGFHSAKGGAVPTLTHQFNKNLI